MTDPTIMFRRLLTLALALAVTAVSAADEPLQDLQQALQDHLENVSPSIIRLSITSPPVVGLPESRTEATGVFVDKQGHFVTTVDVIRGNLTRQQYARDALRKKITYHAMLNDGKTVPARLVALDLLSRVALMKVEDVEAVPVTLAPAKSLRQGQVVMGVASSTFKWGSPTLGMTGPRKRMVISPDRYLSVMLPVSNPVFSGDMGGALFNVKGQLVGIIGGVCPDERAPGGRQPGATLVIPADTLARVTHCLIKKKCVARGYLGVSLVTGRTIVEDVKADSPAHKAGFLPKDRVLSIKGPFLDEPLALESDQGAELRHIISNCRPDVELTLVVLRGDEKKSITVKLGPRIDQQNE